MEFLAWRLKGIKMPNEQGERAAEIPKNMVVVINKVVRTSRQMLPEIGRQPTAQELAERLAMPLDKLRKVLEIAHRPIRLDLPVVGASTD